MRLLGDADGDVPLICASEGGTPPWLGPIVLEIACNFVTGFYVRMSNVVVNCNGGDFGVGVLMIDDTVSHDVDSKIVRPEHAVASGVGMTKLSVSLEVLYDDTQQA